MLLGRTRIQYIIDPKRPGRVRVASGSRVGINYVLLGRIPIQHIIDPGRTGRVRVASGSRRGRASGSMM